MTPGMLVAIPDDEPTATTQVVDAGPTDSRDVTMPTNADQPASPSPTERTPLHRARTRPEERTPQTGRDQPSKTSNKRRRQPPDGGVDKKVDLYEWDFN